MTVAASARHQKLIGWLGLLARFASVQVIIQAVGFLSGILIVRSLPKTDYAWFTIANTLLATMGMLADSGISGALTAVGGKVWQDEARFGSLIRTALSFRRRLALGSAVIVTPVLAWMLLKNQAPLATVALVLPIVLLSLSLQLTVGVLNVVISLRQEISRLQFQGLASAFCRLALLALAASWFLDVRVALLAGSMAFGLQVWLLHRWVSTSLAWEATESAEYRQEILAVVRKQAPLTIFYCLQGQIVVWLISIFGNPQRVADLGALGRFAMIFTLFSSVMNGIVVPRFARCQDPVVLRRRYWQVAGALVSMAGALVGLSALFPRALLFVLGGAYANLEHEVWLMMASSALAAMFTTLTALTYCKGWIAPAKISIPMEIVTQLVLILTLNVSTVRGVLLFGIGSSIAPVLLTVCVAQWHMRRLPPAGVGKRRSRMKGLLRRLRGEVVLYLANRVIAHVPSHTLRLAFYRRIMGFELGPRCAIFMNAWFDARVGLKLGARSVINQNCRIDTRGLVEIGEDVSIAAETCILTQDHDPASPLAAGRGRSVKIGRHVFVFTRALILPGVEVGEGAVIAAGAVVTRSVAPYTIVAGSPARPIGVRSRELTYTLDYRRLLW